jgi:hypothetical protein
MSELLSLSTSLESRQARQHLAAALAKGGLLGGAELGGGLPDAVAQIPASVASSGRAITAIDIALANIEIELQTLTWRANVCFLVSIAMGVLLAGAIIWSAVGIRNGEGLDTAKILATLGSTAGGGAIFAYYKYVSGQANPLRQDLFRVSQTGERIAAKMKAGTRP